MTEDAVDVLMPLARSLALASPRIAEWGGVAPESLAMQLVTARRVPLFVPLLVEWLRTAGVRVLTPSEYGVARVIELARYEIANVGVARAQTIIRKLLPTTNPRNSTAKAWVGGILEAAGFIQLAVATDGQMMMAIASLKASRQSHPVRVSLIIRDVLHRSPQNNHLPRRVWSWLNTTEYLDSLSGVQSPYAAFVARVAELAALSRRPDGTVDIAVVTGLVFAVEGVVQDVTPQERAAVLFWLEEAGFSPLVDFAEGDLPTGVRIFPQRRRAALPNGIMRLLGGVVPAPPRRDELTSPSERADFVVWRAAELVSRGAPLDLGRLTMDAFVTDAPTTPARHEVQAYLEIAGLGAHVGRSESLADGMDAVFGLARNHLSQGLPIVTAVLLDMLPEVDDGTPVEHVVERWLRTVGLLGAPVNPRGVIGRLRQAVLDAAFANPGLSAAELAKATWDETNPTPAQIAVVREWLAPDPHGVYAVGLALKAVRENRHLTIAEIAAEVFAYRNPLPGDLQQVFDWLAAAGGVVSSAGLLFTVVAPNAQSTQALTESGRLTAQKAAAYEALLRRYPVPPVDLTRFTRMDVRDPNLPTPEELERGLSPALAAFAKSWAYVGRSARETAAALAPYLPVELQGDTYYVHRLMLEHEAEYRTHFESALPSLGGPGLSPEALTTAVYAIARAHGLHPTMADTWVGHWRRLASHEARFRPLSSQQRTALEQTATSHLHARIGGPRVGGPPSWTDKILYQERLMRVALALLERGDDAAVAEAAAIGREMNLPERGRLLGGAGGNTGSSSMRDAYLQYLAMSADEPEETLMDSVVAESSTAAAERDQGTSDSTEALLGLDGLLDGLDVELSQAAALQEPATAGAWRGDSDQLSGAELAEQSELSVFVEATDPYGAWLGNTAEQWLEARNRSVWDSDTHTMTENAVRTLRPLALTLASRRSAEWGGVDPAWLAARLVTERRVPLAVPPLVEWLRAGGIRVLTTVEAEIALALVAMNRRLAAGRAVSAQALVRLMWPGKTGASWRSYVPLAYGIIEAAGIGMRTGATENQMMLAIAAHKASRRTHSVPVNLIIKEILKQKSEGMNYAGRIRRWWWTTEYLDSLPGMTSPYARFVADAVALAQRTRHTDGTIDVAGVAALVFGHQDFDSVTPEERAAITFWLEEAQLAPLLDSASIDLVPSPVSTFPERNRTGAAAAILRILDGLQPSRPRANEQMGWAERAGFAVWDVAEIASREGKFFLDHSTAKVFALSGLPGPRERTVVAAFLEVGGLGTLVDGLHGLTDYMPDVFARAREQLRRGKPVSWSELAAGLPATITGSPAAHVVEGWLRTVGLAGAPVNRDGVIGRIRQAVLDTAAANPTLTEVELAALVWSEEAPTLAQIAVVGEWLSPDPRREYAVGLARKAVREGVPASAQMIAAEVFAYRDARPDDVQRITAWLTEEGEATLLATGGAATQASLPNPARAQASASAGPEAPELTSDHQGQARAEYEALLHRFPVPPVPLAQFARMDHRDPSLPAITVLRRTLLPALASHAADLAYRGRRSLAEITEALGRSLPEGVSDREGFVHRLMLEYAPDYRGHFESVLSVLDNAVLSPDTIVQAVDVIVNGVGLHKSFADMWRRHHLDFIRLKSAFLPLTTGQRLTLLAQAATYLDARIGGMRLGPRSTGAQMLYEERRMRVAIALRSEGVTAAIAEAAVIGREMELPEQGRLLGGAGDSVKSSAYQQRLQEQDDEESGMDSIHAESSDAAATRPAPQTRADTMRSVFDRLGPEEQQEQADLLAFLRLSTTGWGGNPAELWLRDQNRQVWNLTNPATPTPDTVRVLKPLAQMVALGSADLARFGGAVLRSLVPLLFLPENGGVGIALLADWLAEADIRVLTEREVSAARAIEGARAYAGVRPDRHAMLRDLFPERIADDSTSRAWLAGFLEAAGHPMWYGATRSEMMVALTALRAARARRLTLKPAWIARAVIRNSPRSHSHTVRMENWLTATDYLDSLPGQRSFYTEFVARAVALAESLRSDGTIDLAQVADQVLIDPEDAEPPVASGMRREAVRFWLEQAGLDGLVDSAAGPEPDVVPLFPPRYNPQTGEKIIRLVGDAPPSAAVQGQPLSWGEQADLTVWTAVGLVAADGAVSLEHLAGLVPPRGHQRVGWTKTLASVLEATGLGALVPRPVAVGAQLAAAVKLARRRLANGFDVDALSINTYLRRMSPFTGGARVLDSWFRTLGLIGDPIDPEGVIGRLRAEALNLAAEFPNATAHDLVELVFGERFPTPTQLAVVREWQEEDSRQTYAVGLARRAIREHTQATVATIANQVFALLRRDRPDDAQVLDWLTGAGLTVSQDGTVTGDLARERAVYEALLRSYPVPPVSLERFETLDHRDPALPTLEELERGLPPALAQQAEAMVSDGENLAGVAAALAPLLPRDITDGEGYVHRLMLQHAPGYRARFEAVLPLLDDPALSAAAVTAALYELARSQNTHTSVVDMWLRHRAELNAYQEAFTALSTEQFELLKSQAAVYLNARVGGVTVEPQSAAKALLHDERLLRVTLALYVLGEDGAIAEAELIAHELNAGRPRGRLVGGASDFETDGSESAGDDSSTSYMSESDEDGGSPNTVAESSRTAQERSRQEAQQPREQTPAPVPTQPAPSTVRRDLPTQEEVVSEIIEAISHDKAWLRRDATAALEALRSAVVDEETAAQPLPASLGTMTQEQYDNAFGEAERFFQQRHPAWQRLDEQTRSWYKALVVHAAWERGIGAAHVMGTRISEIAALESRKPQELNFATFLQVHLEGAYDLAAAHYPTLLRNPDPVDRQSKLLMFARYLATGAQDNAVRMARMAQNARVGSATRDRFRMQTITPPNAPHVRVLVAVPPNEEALELEAWQNFEADEESTYDLIEMGEDQSIASAHIEIPWGAQPAVIFSSHSNWLTFFPAPADTEFVEMVDADTVDPKGGITVSPEHMADLIVHDQAFVEMAELAVSRGEPLNIVWAGCGTARDAGQLRNALQKATNWIGMKNPFEGLPVFGWGTPYEWEIHPSGAMGIRTDDEEYAWVKIRAGKPVPLPVPYEAPFTGAVSYQLSIDSPPTHPVRATPALERKLAEMRARIAARFGDEVARSTGLSLVDVRRHGSRVRGFWPGEGYRVWDMAEFNRRMTVGLHPDHRVPVDSAVVLTVDFAAVGGILDEEAATDERGRMVEPFTGKLLGAPVENIPGQDMDLDADEDTDAELPLRDIAPGQLLADERGWPVLAAWGFVHQLRGELLVEPLPEDLDDPEWEEWVVFYPYDWSQEDGPATDQGDTVQDQGGLPGERQVVDTVKRNLAARYATLMERGAEAAEALRTSVVREQEAAQPLPASAGTTTQARMDAAFRRAEIHFARFYPMWENVPQERKAALKALVVHEAWTRGVDAAVMFALQLVEEARLVAAKPRHLDYSTHLNAVLGKAYQVVAAHYPKWFTLADPVERQLQFLTVVAALRALPEERAVEVVRRNQQRTVGSAKSDRLVWKSFALPKSPNAMVITAANRDESADSGWNEHDAGQDGVYVFHRTVPGEEGEGDVSEEIGEDNLPWAGQPTLYVNLHGTSTEVVPLPLDHEFARRGRRRDGALVSLGDIWATPEYLAELVVNDPAFATMVDMARRLGTPLHIPLIICDTALDEGQLRITLDTFSHTIGALTGPGTKVDVSGVLLLAHGAKYKTNIDDHDGEIGVTSEEEDPEAWRSVEIQPPTVPRLRFEAPLSGAVTFQLRGDAPPRLPVRASESLARKIALLPPGTQVHFVDAIRKGSGVKGYWPGEGYGAWDMPTLDQRLTIGIAPGLAVPKDAVLVLGWNYAAVGQVLASEEPAVGDGTPLVDPATGKLLGQPVENIPGRSMDEGAVVEPPVYDIAPAQLLADLRGTRVIAPWGFVDHTVPDDDDEAAPQVTVKALPEDTENPAWDDWIVFEPLTRSYKLGLDATDPLPGRRRTVDLVKRTLAKRQATLQTRNAEAVTALRAVLVDEETADLPLPASVGTTTPERMEEAFATAERFFAENHPHWGSVDDAHKAALRAVVVHEAWTRGIDAATALAHEFVDEARLLAAMASAEDPASYLDAILGRTYEAVAAHYPEMFRIADADERHARFLSAVAKLLTAPEADALESVKAMRPAEVGSAGSERFRWKSFPLPKSPNAMVITSLSEEEETKDRIRWAEHDAGDEGGFSFDRLVVEDGEEVYTPTWEDPLPWAGEPVLYVNLHGDSTDLTAVPVDSAYFDVDTHGGATVLVPQISMTPEHLARLVVGDPAFPTMVAMARDRDEPLHIALISCKVALDEGQLRIIQDAFAHEMGAWAEAGPVDVADVTIFVHGVPHVVTVEDGLMGVVAEQTPFVWRAVEALPPEVPVVPFEAPFEGAVTFQLNTDAPPRLPVRASEALIRKIAELPPGTAVHFVDAIRMGGGVKGFWPGEGYGVWDMASLNLKLSTGITSARAVPAKAALVLGWHYAAVGKVIDGDGTATGERPPLVDPATGKLLAPPVENIPGRFMDEGEGTGSEARLTLRDVPPGQLLADLRGTPVIAPWGFVWHAVPAEGEPPRLSVQSLPEDTESPGYEEWVVFYPLSWSQEQAPADTTAVEAAANQDVRQGENAVVETVKRTMADWYTTLTERGAEAEQALDGAVVDEETARQLLPLSAGATTRARMDEAYQAVEEIFAREYPGWSAVRQERQKALKTLVVYEGWTRGVDAAALLARQLLADALLARTLLTMGRQGQDLVTQRNAILGRTYRFAASHHPELFGIQDPKERHALFMALTGKLLTMPEDQVLRSVQEERRAAVVGSAKSDRMVWKSHELPNSPNAMVIRAIGNALEEPDLGEWALHDAGENGVFAFARFATPEEAGEERDAAGFITTTTSAPLPWAGQPTLYVNLHGNGDEFRPMPVDAEFGLVVAERDTYRLKGYLPTTPEHLAELIVNDPAFPTMVAMARRSGKPLHIPVTSCLVALDTGRLRILLDALAPWIGVVADASDHVDISGVRIFVQGAPHRAMITKNGEMGVVSEPRPSVWRAVEVVPPVIPVVPFEAPFSGAVTFQLNTDAPPRLPVRASRSLTWKLRELPQGTQVHYVDAIRHGSRVKGFWPGEGHGVWEMVTLNEKLTTGITPERAVPAKAALVLGWHYSARGNRLDEEASTTAERPPLVDPVTRRLLAPPVENIPGRTMDEDADELPLYDLAPAQLLADLRGTPVIAAWGFVGHTAPSEGEPPVLTVEALPEDQEDAEWEEWVVFHPQGIQPPYTKEVVDLAKLTLAHRQNVLLAEGAEAQRALDAVVVDDETAAQPLPASAGTTTRRRMDAAFAEAENFLRHTYSGWQAAPEDRRAALKAVVVLEAWNHGVEAAGKLANAYKDEAHLILSKRPETSLDTHLDTQIGQAYDIIHRFYPKWLGIESAAERYQQLVSVARMTVTLPPSQTVAILKAAQHAVYGSARSDRFRWTSITPRRSPNARVIMSLPEEEEEFDTAAWHLHDASDQGQFAFVEMVGKDESQTLDEDYLPWGGEPVLYLSVHANSEVFWPAVDEVELLQSVQYSV
ncbi:hypothetical protein, partial [Streptomyces sp. NPDC058548]